MESCLFGLFVIAIFFDQVQSIRNDRSLIDNLKLDETARQSSQILPPSKLLFRKVFGPGKKSKQRQCYFNSLSFLGPLILWLLPCDLKKSNQLFDSQDMYHV